MDGRRYRVAAAVSPARRHVANHIDADVALDSIGEGHGPIKIAARRVDEHSSFERPK